MWFWKKNPKKGQKSNGKEVDQKGLRTRYPAKEGYRQDLHKFFRSSMEANYARFLNELGVEWEYETERFNFPKGVSSLGITGYVPDFKIYAGKNPYYVEVKGFVDRHALEKARLVHKYYPYINLYFLTARGYRIIEKHYKKRLNWE